MSKGHFPIDHFPADRFPVDRVPEKALDKVPFADALRPSFPPPGAFFDTPGSDVFVATPDPDLFVFYTAFQSDDVIVGFDAAQDIIAIVDETPDATENGYAPPTHTMLYEGGTVQFIDFAPGVATVQVYDTSGHAVNELAFGLF